MDTSEFTLHKAIPHVFLSKHSESDPTVSRTSLAQTNFFATQARQPLYDNAIVGY